MFGCSLLSWTLCTHSCLAVDQILLPHPKAVKIGREKMSSGWVKWHLGLAVLWKGFTLFVNERMV